MRDLDGRPLSRQILGTVLAQAKTYRTQGVVPKLAIVIASADEGAWWYVRALETAAQKCQIGVDVVELSPAATKDEIAGALQQLAADQHVHGILLQTPLPKGVVQDDLLELIPPHKDIDGANPLSAGRLLHGMAGFAPATAEAVLALLDYHDIPLEGKLITVVGRSRIVGKPVANLLLGRNATVTICHSHSTDLAAHTSTADVLVVAVGSPNLITSNMVGNQSVVVDVGTNVVADKLVGDVDRSVAELVAGITPVPGGVGPVTTALILQHTVSAVGQDF